MSEDELNKALNQRDEAESKLSDCEIIIEMQKAELATCKKALEMMAQDRCMLGNMVDPAVCGTMVETYLQKARG